MPKHCCKKFESLMVKQIAKIDFARTPLSISVRKVLNRIRSNFVYMKTYYSGVDTENLKGFYEFVSTRKIGKVAKARGEESILHSKMSQTRNIDLFNC